MRENMCIYNFGHLFVYTDAYYIQFGVKVHVVILAHELHPSRVLCKGLHMHPFCGSQLSVEQPLQVHDRNTRLT